MSPFHVSYQLINFKLLFSVLCCGCVLLSPGCANNPIEPAQSTHALVSGEATSSTGCPFTYTVYHPLKRVGLITLVIGHGFMRDQTNMAGIAESIVSSGIPVVTLNFCSMRLWKGNHRANAEDMQALMRTLQVSHPIYAGFSAGALAALLAGSQDPTTKAVVALELVDSGLLAAPALRRLEAPLYGLFGRPSSCNKGARAKVLLTQFDNVRVSHFDDASHCEFESPSNWLCRMVCGDGDSPSDSAATRQTIIDAVRAIVERINSISMVQN